MVRAKGQGATDIVETATHQAAGTLIGIWEGAGDQAGEWEGPSVKGSCVS